jgi:hypothetical protein
MPRKKKSGSAAWVDRDDAPELTDKFFDRAEIRHGEKVIGRGRPPLSNPKRAVKLRLDADVLAASPCNPPALDARRIDNNKKAGIRPAFSDSDGCPVKPGRTVESYSTLLLSFTFSASTYT